MTRYNTLNVKQSNSQLNKLKSRIKNSAKVTLNLSSNVVGDSNDEPNFSHKLLLTYIEVSSICKAFAKWLISQYNIIKNSAFEESKVRRIH